MVLSKVHQALGFERTKGWYSSAAPLSDDVFQYFQSLDMPIQVGKFYKYCHVEKEKRV